MAEILEYKRTQKSFLETLGMIVSTSSLALIIPALTIEDCFGYVFFSLMTGIILLILSRFSYETILFDFPNRKVFVIKKMISKVRQKELVDFSQIRCVGVSSLARPFTDNHGEFHEGSHWYEIFIHCNNNYFEVIERGSLDSDGIKGMFELFNEKKLIEVNNKARELAERIGCRFLPGKENVQIVPQDNIEAYLPLGKHDIPMFEINISNKSLGIMIAIFLLLGFLKYSPAIIEKIKTMKDIKVNSNTVNGSKKIEIKPVKSSLQEEPDSGSLH